MSRSEKTVSFYELSCSGSFKHKQYPCSFFCHKRILDIFHDTISIECFKMFFIKFKYQFFSCIDIILITINQSRKYSTKLSSWYRIIGIKYLFRSSSIGFKSHKIQLTSGFGKEFHFAGQIFGVGKCITSSFVRIRIDAKYLDRKHRHHLS